MIRSVMCMTALVSLAACGSGTNPFATATDGSDTSTGNVYASDTSLFLVMNNFSYDATNDQVSVSNVPNDASNNVYTLISGHALDHGFAAYESNPATTDGPLHYFAVFRRSDSKNSQVLAVGTGNYADYGYGGTGAQRLGDDPNLPNVGTYTYTGDYAAVKVNATTGLGSGDVNLVTGDATLLIDFGDSGTGTVVGSINNRKIYSNSGALIGNLSDSISFTTADIDRTNGTTKSGTATGVNSDATTWGTGTWQSTFAGPGGSEVAGIVILEGTDQISSDKIREVGGFIAD